jgi:hypothetical protein
MYYIVLPNTTLHIQHGGLRSVTSDIILHVRGLVGPSKRVVRMAECILFIPYTEGRRGCFQTQIQS